ncbi:MAG: hypothetical protein MZW92_18325 [Comamonadaceae bacterium]|nr:hypothetical protein [Comamonadaceae bacterium]
MSIPRHRRRSRPGCATLALRRRRRRWPRRALACPDGGRSSRPQRRSTEPLPTGIRMASSAPSRSIPAIDQTRRRFPDFAAGEVNRVDWEPLRSGRQGRQRRLVPVRPRLARHRHRLPRARQRGDVRDTCSQHKDMADRLRRVPGATRVNVKLVDEAGGRITDVNLPGFSRRRGRRRRGCRPRSGRRSPPASWFVLSGSQPAGTGRPTSSARTGRGAGQGCGSARRRWTPAARR